MFHQIRFANVKCILSIFFRTSAFSFKGKMTLKIVEGLEGKRGRSAFSRKQRGGKWLQEGDGPRDPEFKCGPQLPHGGGLGPFCSGSPEQVPLWLRITRNHERSSGRMQKRWRR